MRPSGEVVVLGSTQSPDFRLIGAQPFLRWRPAINSADSWLAILDDRLQRVLHSRFVGSESILPSIFRFVDRNGFAYVSGQVTPFTGAPAFGNYGGRANAVTARWHCYCCT